MIDRFFLVGLTLMAGQSSVPTGAPSLLEPDKDGSWQRRYSGLSREAFARSMSLWAASLSRFVNCFNIAQAFRTTEALPLITTLFDVAPWSVGELLSRIGADCLDFEPGTGAACHFANRPKPCTVAQLYSTKSATTLIPGL